MCIRLYSLIFEEQSLFKLLCTLSLGVLVHFSGSFKHKHPLNQSLSHLQRLSRPAEHPTSSFTPLRVKFTPAPTFSFHIHARISFEHPLNYIRDSFEGSHAIVVRFGTRDERGKKAMCNYERRDVIPTVESPRVAWRINIGKRRTVFANFCEKSVNLGWSKNWEFAVLLGLIIPVFSGNRKGQCRCIKRHEEL